MVQKSGLPVGHTVLHQSIIIGLRLQSFISPYCNKNYWKESFTSFKNTAAVSGLFSFFSYPVSDIRFGIRRTFVDYITQCNLIIFFVYLITYLFLRLSGLLLRFILDLQTLKLDNRDLAKFATELLCPCRICYSGTLLKSRQKSWKKKLVIFFPLLLPPPLWSLSSLLSRREKKR